MDLKSCKLAFRVLEGPIDSFTAYQLTPTHNLSCWTLTWAQVYRAAQISQKSCWPADDKKFKPSGEALGFGDLWVNQKLIVVVRKSKVGFLSWQPSPLLDLAQLQGVTLLGAPIWGAGLFSSLSYVPKVFEEVDRKRKIPLDGFGVDLTEHGMHLSNCIPWLEVSHRTHLVVMEQQIEFSYVPRE